MFPNLSTLHTDALDNQSARHVWAAVPKTSSIKFVVSLELRNMEEPTRYNNGSRCLYARLRLHSNASDVSLEREAQKLEEKGDQYGILPTMNTVLHAATEKLTDLIVKDMGMKQLRMGATMTSLWTKVRAKMVSAVGSPNPNAWWDPLDEQLGPGEAGNDIVTCDTGPNDGYRFLSAAMDLESVLKTVMSSWEEEETRRQSAERPAPPPLQRPWTIATLSEEAPDALTGRPWRKVWLVESEVQTKSTEGWRYWGLLTLDDAPGGGEVDPTPDDAPGGGGPRSKSGKYF